MHGFIYEIFLLKGKENKNFLPQSLENKIVVLADMYYNQAEQRVELDDRLDDIEARYKDDKDFLKAIQPARRRMKELESEIVLLMSSN